MAMNPMKRRTVMAFASGILVMLIVLAVVVIFMSKIVKEKNEIIEQMEAKQSQAFVAVDDLYSGDEITEDDIMSTTVQTTMSADNIISYDDFENTSYLGEELDTEDMTDEELEEYEASLEKTKLIMKIDVPAGTIITKDMFYAMEDKIDDTTRIQEYYCIELPSHLKNGDYIDIRFSLANGQDYIVLSKVKVQGCTATGLWLYLDEMSSTLLNCAMYENSQITGSRLYAVEYIEPGMQEEAQVTYIASEDIISFISSNPNIVDKLKQDYANKVYYYSNYRSMYIGPALEENKDEASSVVSSTNQSNAQAKNTQRSNYVSELEGTDDIGYTMEEQD